MQQINARVESYTNVRPDAPLPEQYANYMTSVLTGDLGTSIWHNEPVSMIMAKAIPWTVFVSSVSLILTFVIGICLGAIMAYYEGSQFDVSSTILTTLLNAIPYYIAAIILLYFLGFQGGFFPTGGRFDPDTTPGLNLSFILSIIHYGALPIFSFVITGIDPLGMRGNSISVLGSDYVRVARLRGLSDMRISIRYVAHNAILPFYTGLLISIGGLIGGSVIMEQIFSYPGVGYYIFESISSRDYPLMMGGFLVLTVCVVIGVYIADLTYGKVDPRAGTGDQRESY
ncbi:ABC transporter permease [Halomontanus rarus]|uniref:ABC transporter permease n=1 Tax=Halomontanus rarus TaxID=3034020 RepID=UPI00293C105C|nr:ABC transporter permease [Halovivax sp. KZCA124]